jgi:hypothetical protein
MHSALKLGDAMALLRKEQGHDPTVKEIATLTGLTSSAVHRLMDLIALPDEFKRLILDELKKPKSEQKFTEDFFYELQKALNTIERYEPQFFDEFPRAKVTRALIDKYESGVINNLVRFRDVSRIARGSNEGVPERVVLRELRRLVTDDAYTIENAFAATVEVPLLERDLIKRIIDLRERLGDFSREQLEDEILGELQSLAEAIAKLLK